MMGIRLVCLMRGEVRVKLNSKSTYGVIKKKR